MRALGGNWVQTTISPLIKYILLRLSLVIPTVFFLTIIVFGVIHMIPGDPITVMFGYDGYYPKEIERVKKFSIYEEMK